MKAKLEALIKYFLFSAGNDTRGGSGKKIIAYFIALCVVVMHSSWLKNAHEHNDYSLFIEVLKIDFFTICVLHGINVTDKKLNSQPNEAPPSADKP